METLDLSEDAESFFGEIIQNPNQNSVSFITSDKFGFLVDMRSMKDHPLHGNGIHLATAIEPTLLTRAETDVDEDSDRIPDTIIAFCVLHNICVLRDVVVIETAASPPPRLQLRFYKPLFNTLQINRQCRLDFVLVAP